jgi:hypothetical protein
VTSSRNGRHAQEEGQQYSSELCGTGGTGGGRSVSPAQRLRHWEVMAAACFASRAEARAAFEAPRVAMWAHVPGARVYEGLFPSYVLPSGAGAYLYR